MRLEPRPAVPLALGLLAPVGAVAAALLISALLVAWSGASIPRAYALLFEGAVGTRFSLTETLTRATPLVLTGLAAAVAFRARFWNVGAEGQLYAGAIAATLVAGEGLAGVGVGLPAWAPLPLALVCGALAGALLLLGPALLKTRLGVDEVVTTLLLNFVVALFVSMMLEGPMKDPMGMGWPQSPPVLPEAELPRLVERTRLHAGLLVALFMAFAVWVMTTRTVWGYEARAVGGNPRAAAFAGMPVGWVMVRTALLSGALAGLAGAVEVLGAKQALTLDLSPGFGYSGIVVAMLAQLHPIGVVAGAVFVAGIFVGSDAMSRGVAVPTYISDVIVAVSLICMIVATLLVRYRIRRG
jgi:simple sugar transport system permease protein